MKGLDLLPAVLFLIVGPQAICQGPPQTPIRIVNGVGVEDPNWEAAMKQKLHNLDVLMAQGRAALKKGDTAKATSLLEQAAGVQPFFEEEPRIILSDIYLSQGKTSEVARILRAMIYPPPKVSSWLAHLPVIRMKYVLAVLDNGSWQEAATVYEESFSGESVERYHQSTNGNLKWALPGNIGPAHTIPEAHFSADNPDYSGLRAQAHLILGACEPQFIAFEDKTRYMLDHLKQSIKYNPYSPDAHFLSGILLDSIGKFTEARAEFKRSAKLLRPEAQEQTMPEINKALRDVDSHEKRKKDWEAIEAARSAVKAAN